MQTHVPQVWILLNTFYVLRHLATAMNQIPRMEYKRVAAKGRNDINGLCYPLLAHRPNLMLAGLLAPWGAAAKLFSGCVSAQRGILAILGLSPGRRGPPALHHLAGAAEMATTPVI